MWLLNGYLDKLGKDAWNSKWNRFLWWLNVAFAYNPPPGGCGTLYERIPDASGWWVRCPLFAIGHYHKSPQQNTDALCSGWSIDWCPYLSHVPGRSMYRYHWDNLKVVMTRRELAEMCLDRK